jgi:pentatricopeptide repeat protein
MRVSEVTKMLRIFPRAVLAATAAILLALPLAAQSYEEALAVYKRGAYAQAEPALRAVTQAHPDNADAFYYLGSSLVELNRIDEARGVFDQAREKGLSADRSKAAEGQIAIQQKQLDAASAALNEAVGINANNAEAHFYLGLAEATRGNFPASSEHLEKSVELDPFRMHAHYYAGIAANRLKRPDRMVDHFRYVQKLAPESDEARKVEALLKSVR